MTPLRIILFALLANLVAWSIILGLDLIFKFGLSDAVFGAPLHFHPK